MNRIKSFVIAHKIISFFVLVIFIGATYWGYKKFTSTAGDTRYVTTKVGKSTIIATVSGSGQVSAVSQIDVKSKASGDVINLPVQDGAKVQAGAIIAQLDAKDANKSVRDAETSLLSAQLSLEKLKIQNSNENLNAGQKKSYDDGFNTVTETFLDLTPTFDGLKDILDRNNLSDNAAQANGKATLAYRDKAVSAFFSANLAFKQNTKDYVALNNNSPINDIENIIQQTSETTRLLSDALKSTVNFVDIMANSSNDASTFTSIASSLSSYTNTINGHLADLMAAETNINNNKDSFQNSSIDIRNAELSVKQKENALQDAKDKLADYFVRAPFAGTVTNINIKKSDSVGSGTVVATLITDRQIAEISLNEVDVAKIKTGEKATLIFDAIPDLTISGVVAEINSIGAVSQGVVTYNVKINFDTQEARVKAGMSVTSAIITDMKQDVLAVQNSALKSERNTSYVEMFDAPLAKPTDGLIGSISKIAPNKIPVEVGLSNDSQTEIISGIKEGDEIVTRVILPTAGASTAAPSIFGAGGRGAVGGAVRTPVR